MRNQKTCRRQSFEIIKLRIKGSTQDWKVSSVVTINTLSIPHLSHSKAEAVRLMRVVGKSRPPRSSIRGSYTPARVRHAYLLRWCWQPHGGNSMLLRCWQCRKPYRALYGVRVDRGEVKQTDWQCRTCAGLRYSSEGGALLMNGTVLTRLLSQPLDSLRFPGPEKWLPHIFPSFEAAVAAGYV